MCRHSLLISTEETKIKTLFFGFDTTGYFGYISEDTEDNERISTSVGMSVGVSNGTLLAFFEKHNLTNQIRFKFPREYAMIGMDLVC